MTSTATRLAAFLLFLAVVLTVMTGCRTPPDSDMPWNTPQPWEGNPQVPGITQE